MDEPKSCPFCGGEVIEPDFEDGDCVYWIDHDKSCFLKIKEVSTFFDIYLEAWNTRHEHTCVMQYRLCSNTFVCSKCGERTCDEQKHLGGLNFCPNCGAKVIN